MRRFSSIVLLALSGGCTSEPASSGDPTGDALVRGSLVAPGELRSVIELGHGDESFCTGAKVGERHVLTAAHCIIVDPEDKTEGCVHDARDGDESPSACERNAKWQGRTVRLRVRSERGDRWITAHVKKLSMPASVIRACSTTSCFWDTNGHRRVPDIALVEVEETIPDATTAIIDRRRIHPDTEILTLGYGCTRSSPTWIGDDELRQAESRTVALESIPADEMEELTPPMRSDLVATYFFSPASAVRASSLCPGDSGGPLLRPTGEIIGINAYYLAASRGQTMRANMFTRLDARGAGGAHVWLARALPASAFRD